MPRCAPFTSKTPLVKGALCSFEEEVLIRGEISSLTDLCFFI